MEQVLAVLTDWRFGSCVALISGFLGPWIFRKIPVPADTTAHLEQLQRAHAASRIAGEAGIHDVQNVAQMAGVVAGLGVISSLRRQNRQAIVVGVIIAAVLSAIGFLTLPVASVPIWMFVVAGIVGVFRLWKAW